MASCVVEKQRRYIEMLAAQGDREPAVLQKCAGRSDRLYFVGACAMVSSVSDSSGSPDRRAPGENGSMAEKQIGPLEIELPAPPWPPEEWREWQLMDHILRQHGPNRYSWEFQETFFAEDGSDQMDIQMGGYGFVEGDVLYLSSWKIRAAATQETIRRFAGYRDSLAEWDGSRYIAWFQDSGDDVRVYAHETCGYVRGTGVPAELVEAVQAVMVRHPFHYFVPDGDGAAAVGTGV